MGPSNDFSMEKSCKCAADATSINLSQHTRFPIRSFVMKVLTLNFVTCAIKACKGTPKAHPLHPKDAELVHDELEVNADMIVNVLPRLDWEALRTTSSEVRLFPPPPGRQSICRLSPCSLFYPSFFLFPLVALRAVGMWRS